MGKGAFLFNVLAERYARTPIANQQAYEKKLEITRKYLTTQSRVFEFGCGTGSTALLHAPYVEHIHAIDYAKKMIEIANRKKAEAGVQNATFDVSDIDDFQIEQGKYDVILGLNILTLMENIDIPIAKCWSLLKPGGYFISSSVCMTSPPPGVLRLLIPLMGILQIFPRLKGFSEQQLIGSMESAGFQIVEQYNPEGEALVVFLVARKSV